MSERRTWVVAVALVASLLAVSPALGIYLFDHAAASLYGLAQGNQAAGRPFDPVAWSEHPALRPYMLMSLDFTSAQAEQVLGPPTKVTKSTMQWRATTYANPFVTIGYGASVRLDNGMQGFGPLVEESRLTQVLMLAGLLCGCISSVALGVGWRHKRRAAGQQVGSAA